MTIPVRLVFEGTATTFAESPDLIAAPVDPMVSHRELRYAILDLNTWPSAIDTRDRATAVDNAIRSLGDHPFLELAPEDPPEGWNVRPHPTIRDMWLVIDPEIDIDSSWLNREQAVWTSWALAADRDDEEYPPQHYALFRIALDRPPGYRITLGAIPNGYDVAYREGMLDRPETPWVMRYYSGVDCGAHATEFAAKIAAWQHHLTNAKPELGFKAGGVEGPSDCDNWTAEIDHTYADHTWHAQVEIHGKSEAEATELRDRILKFLQGEA